MPSSSSADAVFAHAQGTGYLHLWREVILTYRQMMRGLTAATGYTGAQFEVLRQLAIAGGRSTVSQVARELSLDPAAVTRVVAELAGLGLVARERDERDARRRPVVLSDEGRRRMTELHARLHEHEAALSAGLDAGELETAVRVLQEMRAAVDRMSRRPV